MEETNERPFPAVISDIVDKKTVVINRGSNDGIDKGDSFVLYKKGKEIIDPETNKSLGELEIVVGYGIASHVQDAMSTIVSSQVKHNGKRIIRKPRFGGFSSYFGTTEEEVIGEGEIIPFKDPEIGDFVKQI